MNILQTQNQQWQMSWNVRHCMKLSSMGGSMGLLSYSLAIATQKKHHKISQTCLQMEPTVTAARTESMCTLATGLAGGLLQHCSVFYRELV